MPSRLPSASGAWPAETTLTRGSHGLLLNVSCEKKGGVGLELPATAVQQMTNILPDLTHTYGACLLWYCVLRPSLGTFPPVGSLQQPNIATAVTPVGDPPCQREFTDHPHIMTHVRRRSFLSPARLRRAIVSPVRRWPRGWYHWRTTRPRAPIKQR